MKQGNTQHGQMHAEMGRMNYRMLGISSLAMLIMMYLIMFTMIYSWSEFIQNINFFYMAVMMATPMTLMMPLMMKSMYPDKKLNLLIYVGGAVLFVLAFIGIRGQLLVGDRQFLRSMIPHHSGAILMCNQSNLRDAEIRELCFGPQGIVESQKREVAQMKQILERL